MQESNFKEFAFWLFGLRRRYQVVGASMQPLLNAGDEVLVDPRAYRGQSPREGDIVVAQHPEQVALHIIKRVKLVQSDGRFHLSGDNPDPHKNSDSLVALSLILGRVTSRFAPAEDPAMPLTKKNDSF